MFSGIIEALGHVVKARMVPEGLRLSIKASFIKKLKRGQSIAHDGVCLTVEKVTPPVYTVTAVKETMDRTNFSLFMEGKKINLERSLKVGGRLDGHFVQGHVDCTAVCKSILQDKENRLFLFSTGTPLKPLAVEKGSISVNGVSLTVVHAERNEFSVAIVPYTMEHTNFGFMKEGDKVNIEFDILGKYIAAIVGKEPR